MYYIFILNRRNNYPQTSSCVLCLKVMMQKDVEKQYTFISESKYNPVDKMTALKYLSVNQIPIRPSVHQYGAYASVNTPLLMQSQKANSAYLGDKSIIPVALLSIPSDSHLCTLHSQHQLATSIQIQIET